MESNAKSNNVKAKSAQVSTTSLRVKHATKKRVQQELVKINKKAFGRQVTADDLVVRLLPMLTTDIVKELQDASLSNTDKFEKLWKEYESTHGSITRDAFIGKLLSGELTRKDASSAM